MTTYNISKSFNRSGAISEKAILVCRMFGLSAERLSEAGITHNCQLRINDGDIVYITGPSGAGKSVLLGEIEKSIAASERVNLNEIKLANDKSLIDCLEGDFLTTLKMLNTAGLNDVVSVLNQPGNLSDGQKWRFRLATALAAKKKFVFADEFCSELDRICAAVIAYNIRKFAKREGVTFVLASSHDDILTDLSPDVLVVKELSGQTEVVYK